MKLIIFILVLFPCLAFGQTPKNDYVMYSKYLEVFKDQRDYEVNFVIVESTNVDNNQLYVNDIIESGRNYLKGDQSAYSTFFTNKFFLDTLKTDTLWLPLIVALHQQTNKIQTIKNKFFNNLQISMLPDYKYNEYFGENKVEEGWASFHEDYPGKSFLIKFSKIESDEKRAVFYFSSQCGGLCGHGCLVLFYKDAKDWRYLGTLAIWDS